LVAVALVALISLISAGCGSNAHSETGTASSTGTGSSKNATGQDTAVKFAECIRNNGVSDFPDPNAKGEFVYGVSVSPAVFKKAVDACSDDAGRDKHREHPSHGVLIRVVLASWNRQPTAWPRRGGRVRQGLRSLSILRARLAAFMKSFHVGGSFSSYTGPPSSPCASAAGWYRGGACVTLAGS